MKKVFNENVVFVDIDDTLISWTKNKKDINLNYYGMTVNGKEIKANTRFLKALKRRGAYIVAFSGNGYRWVEEVVTKLKLINEVDLIMTKPAKYIDDRPFDSYCKRINLNEEHNDPHKSKRRTR